MTREEAIKFLSNTKVFVKNKGKEVQEKLFNIGFKWLAPEEKGIYKDRYFLFLYEDLTLTYVDVDDIEYFYEHRFKEISAEDILNIKVEHLPKTWEEFCEINPIKDYNSEPAFLALMKLHQLRDYYRQGWVPDWSNIREDKYYIINNGTNVRLELAHISHRFLSFQTKELAQQFLDNFRDLIEQAGDLI